MTKMVFKAMTSVLVASVFNLVINVTNLSGEGESFESILIEIIANFSFENQSLIEIEHNIDVLFIS